MLRSSLRIWEMESEGESIWSILRHQGCMNQAALAKAQRKKENLFFTPCCGHLLLF
jgi:hypothetical protein